MAVYTKLYTYVQIEVSVYLVAVLVPGDVRSGSAAGDAEEGYLVPEHVLKIKVRGQQNLGSLFIKAFIFFFYLFIYFFIFFYFIFFT